MSGTYLCTRDQCGGALVDIRGQVVGINIARADLQQTLEIPHTVVREIVAEIIAKMGREAKDN